MNSSVKPVITIVLLVAIAVVLQSYLSFIEANELTQLVLMPGLITFLCICIWLFSNKGSTFKKGFKILSIILMIGFTFWFLFVQYAIALGRGFKN